MASALAPLTAAAGDDDDIDGEWHLFVTTSVGTSLMVVAPPTLPVRLLMRRIDRAHAHTYPQHAALRTQRVARLIDGARWARPPNVFPPAAAPSRSPAPR